jgi:hypothetical protein
MALVGAVSGSRALWASSGGVVEEPSWDRNPYWKRCCRRCFAFTFSWGGSIPGNIAADSQVCGPSAALFER